MKTTKPTIELYVINATQVETFKKLAGPIPKQSDGSGTSETLEPTLANEPMFGTHIREAIKVFRAAVNKGH